MFTRPPRRGFLHAGAALGMTVLLPPARACEFYTTTLRVTHPWTRASAEGETTARVSMRFDEVLQDDRLIAVQTPVAAGAAIGGASARHEVDFAIPAGRTSALEEAGTHLLLIDLRHPLQLARTYPLRLIFEHGGAIEAELNVDYDSPRRPPFTGAA